MRTKLFFAAVTILVAPASAGAEPVEPLRVGVNEVCEVELDSQVDRDDPFNEVTVDAIVTAPSGAALRVPAFWAGGRRWKFRYSSLEPGEHRWQTKASAAADAGLHGVRGTFLIDDETAGEVGRAQPLRVSDDKRHFVLPDGKPFLWIGDTCWMGLTKRLPWPDGFRHYVADRKAKGFNVVQIVAGLYPDMPAFDPRGDNEAGQPWTKDYAHIRPEYFDAADRRIAHLVEHGITPCIVGAWGFHMPWMGEEKLKRHWRYLIARWGAYPVVWCAAGEVNLPYYLVEGFPFDDREQASRWTEVTRYLKETDPFNRPTSTHPTGLGRLSARGAIGDQSLLDFDMLQTGHSDMASLAPSVETARWTYAQEPKMPFLNSEVCYEGILGTCDDRVQRLVAWSMLLSGAAGHTYGANGIWQVNQQGRPYGPSPHGGDYGPTPWDEALKLPGSTHVGIAGRILRGLPWEKFEPHRDWATFADEAAPPQWGRWIWSDESDATVDAADGTRFFRKVIELPRTEFQDATLWIGCDNAATVWINGELLGQQVGWQPAGRLVVPAKLLRPGKNVIAVRAVNEPAPFENNPAGLLVTFASVHHQEAEYSDATWRVATSAPAGWQGVDFDDSSWKPAREMATHGAAPWGSTAGGGNPYLAPYCAGLPDGSLRLIYVPASGAELRLHDLAGDNDWQAQWIDPRDGSRGAPVGVSAARNGDGQAPSSPEPGRDWLLLIKGQ